MPPVATVVLEQILAELKLPLPEDVWPEVELWRQGWLRFGFSSKCGASTSGLPERSKAI
jgi:hypothetical protein